MKSIFAIFLLALSGFTIADTYSYECHISGEYVFDGKGTLTPDPTIYTGEKFNVERKSGVVLGGGVGNSSYPTKQALDPGGKDKPLTEHPT